MVEPRRTATAPFETPRTGLQDSNEVDRVLERFGAQAVVVGHTLQSEVNRRPGGKVIAIDVPHPNDDHKLWPEGYSEGLLIEGGVYYRVREGETKQAI